MTEEALPQRANRRGIKRQPEPLVESGDDNINEQDVLLAANQTHAEEQDYQPEPESGVAGAAEGEHQHQHQLTHIDVPEYRAARFGSYNFEWGASLSEAFEQVALAMFNYMTPIDDLKEDPSLTHTYEVQAHDLQSLLFAFLDELLFVFNTEFFACKRVVITSFDMDSFAITAAGHGEVFERGRHEAGTEIKAITYSAMQIRTHTDAEVFVIVDI